MIKIKKTSVVELRKRGPKFLHRDVTPCQLPQALNCSFWRQGYHKQLLHLRGNYFFIHAVRPGTVLSFHKLNYHLKMVFCVYYIFICTLFLSNTKNVFANNMQKNRKSGRGIIR